MKKIIKSNVIKLNKNNKHKKYYEIKISYRDLINKEFKGKIIRI
jgi:hypothetical protein